MSTSLSKVKNFGPVTRAELEAIGISTLEQIEALGFEETCRKYVLHYPERLNANAFLGIASALDGVVWTQASTQHRKMAHELVKRLKLEGL